MAKYPEGTRVKHSFNGNEYIVTYVEDDEYLLHTLDGQVFGYEYEDFLDLHYVIVSTPPVESEVKVNFIVTGESQFGRWFEYTAIDEDDAKVTARSLSKGLAPGYNVNLTKVYTVPSPESIDF